jgi:hypothetical protein
VNVSIKPGVSVKGLKPECALGLLIAAVVYAKNNVPFVITSVMDGKHMKTSKHYEGLAFDCRLPSKYVVKGETFDDIVVEYLREYLGAEWDVVKEKDHIHVEYDPK